MLRYLKVNAMKNLLYLIVMCLLVSCEIMGTEPPQENETDPATVMSVSEALQSAGSKDVWVIGHIVGGDLSSSSASYEPPFTSKTCILIGAEYPVSSRDSCMSVQLPAGKVRDALNLADNPELLGTKVIIKGDVTTSYYGLVGLKSCDDYRL